VLPEDQVVTSEACLVVSEPFSATATLPGLVADPRNAPPMGPHCS
jgi:hypothetical protein